jgi:alkanesulfonate monooxygenase SsuD/methylene tetrahydromethanopterin reductase-like flavin-dependent oxidoreductase (luciferase family)
MTEIRFGVQFLPQDVSWAEWRDAWVRADELGFDSLWSYDHVHAPRGAPLRPCFEGWIGMAALAALTRRAQIGMLVSAVLFRNPALLVKMATTVDHITGGKSILGLGAGWHANEHQAYGWGFPPAGERVSRLAEALEVTHALWDGVPDRPASFAGTYYRLEGAYCNPPPIRQPHPPIMVAGGGPRIVRLVARHADMWDCWPPLSDVRARYELLRSECDRIGRPADQVVRSVSVDFLYEADPRRLPERVEALIRQQDRDPSVLRARLLSGGSPEMIEQIRTYVDAGVQQLILHVGSPHDLEGVERFAREVVPAFR